MKVRLCRASLSIALLILAGCFGSNQERAQTDEIGKSGFTLVSYTGTTRGAYIWPDGNPRHICAEPPPDLGLTTLREFSANLKAAAESLGQVAAPSLEAGGAAKLSSAAIELAGRSQLVLLTLEFLYRECELAANFSPTEKEYTTLSEQYANVLTVVVTLANAERARATAELLTTQLEVARLNRAQDEDIAKVLGHVTRSDGSINQDALTKLLESSKIDLSFKKSIQSQTSVPDLLEYLKGVPDFVTEALAAAIPKQG